MSPLSSRGATGFAWLLVCFFLSGLAALVYQTAWTRQFALVFGTSELATATVLAAYMGGLAAGAAAAGRLVSRIRRPVLAYGLLELGVAGAALALPLGIRAAQALYVAAFGGSELLPEPGLATALFYLGASFVLLAVPTGLMGATLPLLARHAVRREAELGSRIGFLYASNTLGAVAGTLLAGFVLLPALGLARTIWVAAACNALVFAAALGLARRAAPAAVLARGAPRGRLERREWVLPLVLVSGAVSFGYEIVWSRLLVFVLGGSLYAFATMLASFLAGIALGSALAAPLARDAAPAARRLGWVELGAGACAFLAYTLLDRAPDLARALGGGGPSLLADVGVCAVFLLPSTLCLGATFPFAVRVLARDESDAGQATARVLAWNTLGAILGAVGAGFFGVPALGFEGALALAVAANGALALAAPALGGTRSPRLRGLAAAGLAALALLPPGPPWTLLRTAPLRLELSAGPVVYHGVGRSATVLLLGERGGFGLTTNGLPEARIQPPGAPTSTHPLEHWLTLLPSLARPETRRVLVVGLGGGVALELLPASVGSAQVVELEREVIRANRAVAGRRRSDPLADPRVRLVENDARNALLLAAVPFDAIVSQPSHPWTEGASHLYTREFFGLARERLTPGGVLVQWIGLRYVDAALLRSLLATLLDVFPHVRVYEPLRGGVLFLASAQPLDVEAEAWRALAGAPDEFGALGIERVEDVAAALALDEAGVRAFAGDAPLIRDDDNRLLMRSPALARSGEGPPDTEALFAPHDPLAALPRDWDRVYLVRRLLAAGLPERAKRLAASAPTPASRALGLGLVAQVLGQTELALARFGRALELEPDSLAARLAWLALQRRAGAAPLVVPQPPPGPVPDPARAVLEGLGYEARGDWSALGALEPRLAAASPRDPARREAIRLRCAWRLSEGSPGPAREALALLARILPSSIDPADLLLQARLALAAEAPAGALATLFDLVPRLRPGADTELARQAFAVALRLPAEVAAPEELDELLSALGAAPAPEAGSPR